MKKIGIRILLILMACLCAAGSLGEEKNPYDLPLDMDFVNEAPDPEGFSQNAYHDPSLDVEIECRIFREVKCFIAHIRVKSPTQLRTAVAGKPNQKATALPSDMSRAVNAVVAINGEFYIQRTRDIFIYRQGVMYRDKPDKAKDVLIIDAQGDFHIFTGDGKAEEIVSYMESGGTVVNAFSFGPGLMADGEMLPIRNDYYFYPGDRLWRSFIGQEGPLAYVFVILQGAQQKDEYLLAQELGLIAAYNLDGGNSAVMLFNGKYVGDKSPYFEREQSDIVYVVSAAEHGAQ